MSLVIRKNKSLFPEMITRLWDAEKSLLADFFDFDGGLMKWNGDLEVPAMNVIEDPKEYRIEIAAPGKTRDDFKIEVEEGMLTVSCEKKEEKEENKANYRRQEFSFDYFSRSMMLPENTLPEKISAKYENGVLLLTLPREEVVVEKPKKLITVA